MRTVQQNVFLILDSVPVTSVTDPELIRPSIPVMTHSLGVTRMAYSPSLWLMANWQVKQNQPVSKIETKSDTNLRSLYESIQKCIDLKISDTVMTS